MRFFMSLTNYLFCSKLYSTCNIGPTNLMSTPLPLDTQLSLILFTD